MILQFFAFDAGYGAASTHSEMHSNNKCYLLSATLPTPAAAIAVCRRHGAAAAFFFFFFHAFAAATLLPRASLRHYFSADFMPLLFVTSMPWRATLLMLHAQSLPLF